MPPPPGPFRPGFWRSPIRGPWLTSVFGLVLLICIPLLFVTGLLSYASYNPGLSPLNDETPDKGVLGFYLFSWPTHPYWFYRLLQGVHVTLGVVLVPVLLAKLWSVIPKLFEWLPVRSVAHGLERLSLLMLVGGVIFEFVTGILNIQLYYVFPGSFYRLHFYGAWVFIAAFVVHVCLKLGRMTRTLRSRSLSAQLRTDLAHTVPEPPDPDGLVAAAPAQPTMTRRGASGAGSHCAGRSSTVCRPRAAGRRFCSSTATSASEATLAACCTAVVDSWPRRDASSSRSTPMTSRSCARCGSRTSRATAVRLSPGRGWGDARSKGSPRTSPSASPTSGRADTAVSSPWLIGDLPWSTQARDQAG
ncbi:hypothetical protein [Streptomyces griseochromogenes]|uniref:hypothetical protein n=1 Tax=Streptomyces griseochromogenes TaxID=68214 RepID=UPI00379BAC8D